MKKESHIEICYLVDFRKTHEAEIPPCRRIYFGHETCEKLLPQFDEIEDLLEICEKRNLELSFVTPFLTDAGIEKVMRFLERLQSAKRHFEIVISDWGLLNLLTSNRVGTPVAGRFLIGQHTDFRLKRLSDERTEDKILSMNGSYYRLMHRKISPELSDHISACTLLKNRTSAYFCMLEIDRFELSNTLVPIKLSGDENFHFSLHTPYVPLSVFKTCPEGFELGKSRKSCNFRNCRRNREKWTNPGSGQEILCIDNALWYCNPEYESQLQDPRIDRVVFDISF
ncbi:MAG: hypothetical protein FWG22_06555 [Prolixibacteraceae bacterium]|nr:hypothetical protein [Prolixibacteraceae bacterium]